MLNEQLKSQINAEGQARKVGFESRLLATVAESEYCIGAEIYASKWQEEKELRERYEKALKFILAWQFPPTGQFWDDDKTQPMSYAACYGSNGERDFMRNVANEALTPKTSTDDTVNG